MFKKGRRQLDRDENGRLLMSKYNLKCFCEDENLFQMPHLNEKLYLNHKGLGRIQNLEEYSQLYGLWLNNNSLERIEGLEGLSKLTSLFLNNNAISQIEGLDSLARLSILNLSHNRISKVQGLSGLTSLLTLNLSFNNLYRISDLRGLAQAPTVTSLDLSNNEISHEEEGLSLLQIISEALPALSCLYLKQTPAVRTMRYYRKTAVSKIPNLKFLDDRPVFSDQRRLCDAWGRGGREAQDEQRVQLARQKQEKIEKDYQDIRRRHEEVQRRRDAKFQLLAKELLARRLQAESEGDRELAQNLDAELQGVRDEVLKMNMFEEEEKATRLMGFSSYVDEEGNIRINNRTPEEERIILQSFEERTRPPPPPFQPQSDDSTHHEEGESREALSSEHSRLDESNSQSGESIRSQAQDGLVYEEIGLVQPPAKPARVERPPKWRSSLEPLLERILERNEFNFEEALIEMNCACRTLSRKMGWPHQRFQAGELESIWTEVQRRRQGLGREEEDLDLDQLD